MSASPKYVGPGEAVKLFFSNFLNFRGRSTRSEFWWLVVTEDIDMERNRIRFSYVRHLIAAAMLLLAGLLPAGADVKVSDLSKNGFFMQWDPHLSNFDWYDNSMYDQETIVSIPSKLLIAEYLSNAGKIKVSHDKKGYHFSIPSLSLSKSYETKSSDGTVKFTHVSTISMSEAEFHADEFKQGHRGEGTKSNNAHLLPGNNYCYGTTFTADKSITAKQHIKRTDVKWHKNDEEKELTITFTKFSFTVLAKVNGKDEWYTNPDGNNVLHIYATVTYKDNAGEEHTVNSYFLYGAGSNYGKNGMGDKYINNLYKEYKDNPSSAKLYKEHYYDSLPQMITSVYSDSFQGCSHPDSKIRFNDFYGEVKIRCNDDEDDAYEFAELDTVIHEYDRIKTEEDSGAILGLRDMSTFTIKPESIIIIKTGDGNTSKWQMLKGCILGNIQKTNEGKNLNFEMSQCVAGIKGTVFALEDDGKTSRVYTLAGEVEVTAKKGGKKQSVKAGQTVSVAQDGKLEVKSFDIEQEAGRFGIPMEDITRHYEEGYVPSTAKKQGSSAATSGAAKAKGSGKSNDSAKADGTKKKSKGWIVVAVIAVLLVLFLRRKPKQPARSMQMPQPMQPGMGMQSPGMQPGPTQSPGQPYGSTMGQPFQNMGQPQQFGQPQQNMGGYSVVQCPYCGTQIAQGTRFCTGCGAQLM